MQIVIDMDTVDYEYIKNGCIIPIKIDNHIYDAIRKGTPLPKGHGGLYDETELKKEAIRCEWSRNMYDTLDHTLSYMKPIIEADKGESEG